MNGLRNGLHNATRQGCVIRWVRKYLQINIAQKGMFALLPLLGFHLLETSTVKSGWTLQFSFMHESTHDFEYMFLFVCIVYVLLYMHIILQQPCLSKSTEMEPTLNGPFREGVGLGG